MPGKVKSLPLLPVIVTQHDSCSKAEDEKIRVADQEETMVAEERGDEELPAHELDAPAALQP